MSGNGVNKRAVIGLLGVASIVLGVLFAPAASAHGGPGKIVVVTPAEGATVSTGTPVVYDVSLTFEEDGDAVTDGTLTMVATNSAGEKIGPITLTPGSGEGKYTGTITYPTAGQWNLLFTSIEPDATLTRVETAASAIKSTTPSTPSSVTADSTTPPSTVVTTMTVATTKLEVPAAKSDGISTGLIVGIALAAAAIVGAAVFMRGRGRSE